MAVKPEDLLAPLGELEPDLFPNEERPGLLQRLEAYLTDAEAQGAATDQARRAWAYHRAYKAVYIAMSANPIQAQEEGQGMARYDAKQAQRFLDMSNEWLAVFQGETTAKPTGRAGTLSQRAEYTW